MTALSRMFAAAALIATATTSVEASVTATYHDYGSVAKEQTFCNVDLGDKFITAYTNVGSDLKCGDCIRVTNVATGASTKVKVVDKGGAIFDLSIRAFDAIDTNGQGYARGHLDIDYVKVAC